MGARSAVMVGREAELGVLLAALERVDAPAASTSSQSGRTGPWQAPW